MQFEIWFKDGHREHYTNRYNENDEQERDMAWEDVHNTFYGEDIELIDEY